MAESRREAAAGTGARSKARLTLLSRVLISSGLLLVAFWALALIHSEIGSNAALAQFRSPAEAEATGDVGAAIDTSLWSRERIAAFRDSLTGKFDPPIAVMAIPRVGLEAPVFRGTDDLTLNRGIGWIAGTAEPGSEGNSGIAGHRDGFFRGLKDIAVADVIELRTREGVQTFKVRDVMIVEPSRVEVLAPSQESTLTLVTCYPFYFVGSAPQRFIVRAVRDTWEKTPPPAVQNATPNHGGSD